MIVHIDRHPLNQVRTVIKRYAPEEIEDVESLIYLGQLEMAEGT